MSICAWKAKNLNLKAEYFETSKVKNLEYFPIGIAKVPFFPKEFIDTDFTKRVT
ncbi:MAG: hypothetical protein ABI045_00940 [Flavobacteriales bacterium]